MIFAHTFALTMLLIIPDKVVKSLSNEAIKLELNEPHQWAAQIIWNASEHSIKLPRIRSLFNECFTN
jgi:hypothetical protein